MALRCLRALVPLLLCALLGACGFVSDWFGRGEDPPLPGKRIAILTDDSALQADRSIENLRVRLPEPYVNDTWDQPGGNAVHALYHLSLGEDPEVDWTADVGDGSSDDSQILAEPLVVGDTVYAMDSRSTVTAFETESGDRRWRVDLSDDDEEDDGFFGGGITFGSGRIFASTGFAKVFALDAGSGEILWSQPIPGPMRAAPTYSDGRIFVVSVDNQLHALDARTGAALWSHTGIQEVATLLGGSSPAVQGSTVIAPYSSGELFALLAENGRVLWSDLLASVRRIDPIADMADIRGLPVIDRGLVLAASNAGRMIAIDLRRGERAWDIDLSSVQTPWVGGDFIYVVSADAQLVCLTRANGGVRWVQPLQQFEDEDDRQDPITWRGPVLAGGRLVLAGSHGKGVWVSPRNGEVQGEFNLPGAAAVTPVVAGNTVYFLTEGATLVAMR
ncbi:MAG: PQQ-binding-like beta-propeller repeat protein [Kiloniellales bacterium]|nr:PQQ-binding-like beta-propeller repeat protein [Kiloniellales bacterium]